jgi:hypothetical protein
MITGTFTDVMAVVTHRLEEAKRMEVKLARIAKLCDYADSCRYALGPTDSDLIDPDDIREILESSK